MCLAKPVLCIARALIVRMGLEEILKRSFRGTIVLLQQVTVGGVVILLGVGAAVCRW